MAETDQLTAALAEVRERVDQSRYASAIAPHIASAADVPRLLAALDALLARHVPKTVSVTHLCGGHRRIIVEGCPDCTTTVHKVCAACDPACPDDNLWPCQDVQAITRALLPEDDTSG